MLPSLVYLYFEVELDIEHDENTQDLVNQAKKLKKLNDFALFCLIIPTEYFG